MERNVCCICGRVLPTKYAVAGRCEAEGCEQAFCSLHWHNGNRRCTDHGWKPGGILSSRKNDGKINMEKTKMSEEPKNEHELCAQAETKLSAEKKQSILRQVTDFVVKVGTGAGALAKRLVGIRSPEEALKAIEDQIAENRMRREPVTKRHEEVYRLIVLKKKDYQAAPPARKRILEMELKSAIAEYQTLERQVAAYLQNETVLVKVKGRMAELMAASLKSVSEKEIDKLTDRVDEAAAREDDIAGAINDLDKAGARAVEEDDSFAEVLAGFGDELPEMSEPTSAAAPTAVDPTAVKADPLADF